MRRLPTPQQVRSYDARDWHRLLFRLGFRLDRTSRHYIYKKGKKTFPLPKDHRSIDRRTNLNRLSDLRKLLTPQ